MRDMTPVEPPQDEITREAVEAVRAHRLRDADPEELAVAEPVADELFETLSRGRPDPGDQQRSR